MLPQERPYTSYYTRHVRDGNAPVAAVIGVAYAVLHLSTGYFEAHLEDDVTCRDKAAPGVVGSIQCRVDHDSPQSRMDAHDLRQRRRRV